MLFPLISKRLLARQVRKLITCALFYQNWISRSHPDCWWSPSLQCLGFRVSLWANNLLCTLCDFFALQTKWECSPYHKVWDLVTLYPSPKQNHACSRLSVFVWGIGLKKHFLFVGHVCVYRGKEANAMVREAVDEIETPGAWFWFCQLEAFGHRTFEAQSLCVLVTQQVGFITWTVRP
jgi:hypothetical protein